MLYQIFFSPQVKRCAIITYKHGIYELPHELPNDLSQDLRKLENIRKVPELDRMILQCAVFLQKQKFCQFQQKTLEKQISNFSCSALFQVKTRVSLKQILTDCRTEHQRPSLSKENTIEQKHISAPFSSLSLPNPQLNLKFGSQTKPNMQNSMAIFHLSLFRSEIPFFG